MSRCEFPVTWRLFRKEAFLEQLRGRALSINIYFIVLMLFFLFVLRGGRFVPFIAALILACLYMVLLNWLVRADRSYKRYSLLWGGAEWTMTVVFRSTSLVISEGRSVREVSYGHVLKLTEKPGETQMSFRDGEVLIIPDGSFTEGSREEAMAKVASGMGKAGKVRRRIS